jgi:hypothetical protein
MAIIINPRTGMPLDTSADEVDPNDLQTQPVPTLLPAPDSGVFSPGAPGAAPVPGPPPNGVDSGVYGSAPPPAPAPDEPAPVELPPEQVAPAVLAPVTPRPRPAGGTGSGAGAGAGPAPGAETTGEAAARGKEEAAQARQISAADKETELNERKAAGAEDAARSEQQHIGEMDRIREEKYAAANDHLQGAEDKVANYKVRDIFEGRPGAEVAAALMEGLGALAAGLTGGENHAAKVLARNAAGFRQRQLDQLEQLNKGVGNAKDRMEFVRIELAAKEAGMYKRLAADRASNIARFGGDQAAVDGDKIHSELLAQQATSQRTWQTLLHTRKGTEQLQASQISENNASAAKSRAEAGAVGEKGGKKDPALLDVTGPDGKVMFRARSPEEASSANTRTAAVRDVLAKTKELQGLLGQGRTMWGSDREARMEALQSDIIIGVNHAEKLGALDNGTVAIVGKMVPTGAGWSGQGPARLDQFIKTIRGNAAKNFDSYGVKGQAVVDYLERADAPKGGAGSAKVPAPSRSEYATEMERLKTMKPGSPEYKRQVKGLNAARAAMGM